jgi:hypothetical protein
MLHDKAADGLCTTQCRPQQHLAAAFQDSQQLLLKGRQLLRTAAGDSPQAGCLATAAACRLCLLLAAAGFGRSFAAAS